MTHPPQLRIKKSERSDIAASVETDIPAPAHLQSAFAVSIDSAIVMEVAP